MVANKNTGKSGKSSQSQKPAIKKSVFDKNFEKRDGSKTSISTTGVETGGIKPKK